MNGFIRNRIAAAKHLELFETLLHLRFFPDNLQPPKADKWLPCTNSPEADRPSLVFALL